MKKKIKLRAPEHTIEVADYDQTQDRTRESTVLVNETEQVRRIVGTSRQGGGRRILRKKLGGDNY